MLRVRHPCHLDCRCAKAALHGDQHSAPSNQASGTSQQLLVGQQPKLSKNAGPGGEVGLADLQREITKRLARQVAEHRVEIEKMPAAWLFPFSEPARSRQEADLSGRRASPAPRGRVDPGWNRVTRCSSRTYRRHPDPHSRFASNWELSTTRATNVIAFLLDHSKVLPNHVSAAGYAEHHESRQHIRVQNRATAASISSS